MEAGDALDGELAIDVIGVAFAVAIGVGNAVDVGSADVEAPKVACGAGISVGMLESTALAAAV